MYFEILKNVSTALFFVFFFAICFSFAQDEIILNELLERYYEETGKQVQIDQIEQYFKEPIELKQENINKIAELLNVSSLNAKKIISLVKDGFELETICDSLAFTDLQCSLLKYCTFWKGNEQTNITKKIKSNNKNFVEIKTRLYQNFPQNTKYLGNLLDSHNRIKFGYDLFQVGISASKDAGELSFFDNYKYYTSYEQENFKVVLGRFSYQNHFGLVLGNPLGMNKGTDIETFSFPSVAKVSPSLSSFEYGIFNGLGITSKFIFSEKAFFQFSGFISKVRRSGTRDTSLKVVTSISTQDYFRDSNELKKKDNIWEDSYCFNADIIWEKIKLGYTFLYLKYSDYISTSSKKFILGKNSNFHTWFFQYNFNDNLNFSSEFSITNDKRIASVGGFSFKRQSITSSLNFRYFDEEFRSPFGSVISENSYPNNEFGIFYNFNIRLKRANIQFYSDFFKSLSPTYFIQVPIYGEEVFLQAIFPLKEYFSARLKLRMKEKTDYAYNIPKTKQIPYQKITYSLLGEGRLFLFNNLKIATRLDYIWINNRKVKNEENGFHSFIETSYTPVDFLEAGLRVNYFSTTSFDAAVYVFEVVAPEFMYSIPFYGKGLRFTLWCQTKLFNYLKIYLKYYLDKKTSTQHFILGQIDLIYRF